MPRCEVCRGSGELTGIGSGPDGCEPVNTSCLDCDGSGQWTDYRHKSWLLGRALAARRRDACLTVSSAVALCRSDQSAPPSLTVASWNDAERGRSGLGAPIEFATLLRECLDSRGEC